MSDLPVIKGGGEPWTWPDGSLVRVDRSERVTPTGPTRPGTVQIVYGAPSVLTAAGGSGGYTKVGPQDPSGAGGTPPGDSSRTRQPSPDSSLGVRGRVQGIEDWRRLADSLLEGRPTVDEQDAGRGTGTRTALGDREPRLAESRGGGQTRQGRGAERVSATRVAGLVAFVGGAAFIAYGFALGWIDGSLGYDDFMMLGIGLEIAGVLAWRP